VGMQCFDLVIVIVIVTIKSASLINKNAALCRQYKKGINNFKELIR